MEPKINGVFLLDSKVVGKPEQQFLVNGGLYPAVDGSAFIFITPMPPVVKIRTGAVIGRAIRVETVSVRRIA